MALVNHAKKEINAKIVYYGPAGSGKGVALRYIFSKIRPLLRGELKNIPAGNDNLLFFDFSPFESPLLDGYRLRLHVYTLTGDVTNPGTWKMTLKGADGLIIMVDPSSTPLSHINESISQLRDYLSAYGVGLHNTAAVLQLNSPLGDNVSADSEKLAYSTDMSHLKCFLSNVSTGEGVLEALTALSRMLLDRISKNDLNQENAALATVTDESSGQYSVSTATCDANLPETEPLSPDTPLSYPVSITCNTPLKEESKLIIPIEISFNGTDRKITITVSVDQ